MALRQFNIKQGDLLPVIAATLRRADGTPEGAVVDLTGGTVRFLMRSEPGATPKVAAVATVVAQLLGTVQYDWTGTDTDTAGNYQGEFEVTIGGKPYTFPNDDYISIVIKDDVG